MASCLNPTGAQSNPCLPRWEIAIDQRSRTLGENKPIRHLKTESNVWENKRHEFKAFWSSNPKKETTGRKQTDGDTSKPNPLIRKTMTMNLNRAGVQTRTQSTVEHYLKRARELPMKCSCLKMRIRRPMRWCAIWNSAHINGSGRRFVSTKQVWSIGMRANTKKTVIRCSRKPLKRFACCLIKHASPHMSSDIRLHASVRASRNAISRRWLRACRIPNRTVTMQSAPRSGWQQRR